MDRLNHDPYCLKIMLSAFVALAQWVNIQFCTVGWPGHDWKGLYLKTSTLLYCKCQQRSLLKPLHQWIYPGYATVECMKVLFANKESPSIVSLQVCQSVCLKFQLTILYARLFCKPEYFFAHSLNCLSVCLII